MSRSDQLHFISSETRARWQAFVSSHVISDPVLEQAERLQWLWEQSSFCERLCTQYPQWMESLVSLPSSPVQPSPSDDEVQLRERVETVHDDESFKKMIREFRNQKLIEVCWRDLVLQSDVFELLESLSAIADACIRVTIDWLHSRLVARHGEPLTVNGGSAHLTVIALGKLGGRELNFSSDIDVMFCYTDSGNTNGERSISNQEFFIQLSQQMIQCLSDVTADGFAYRVDCRLRPFGESGPLAVNFNHLEDYYQTHGREWERYAFIKARVVCGSEQDREMFRQMVLSFVYRKYIDFGVIDTLREMKRMIAEQVGKARNKNNVKLGAGGIREIEFIVQFFQLVNGGRNTRLQTNHIREALREIDRAGYLTNQEVSELIQAYLYLRRIENRLQMRNDEQTHVLPTEQKTMKILAQSMNCPDTDVFTHSLQTHIDNVGRIFAQISGDTKEIETGDEQYVSLWESLSTSNEGEAEITVEIPRLRDAEHIIGKLTELMKNPAYKNQDRMGRERLQVFMPIFLRHLQAVESPALVMDRLFLLITKILRRSAYLVLLSENQHVLGQLIHVASSSPWIASHLTAYPLLLDELLVSTSSEFSFSKTEIEQQFNDEVLRQSQLDYEHVLEHVRQFKHARELRVACADVQGKLPVMKVSDHLSWTAEAIVQGCLEYLENNYEPVVAGNVAVIAFGKLGGIELSYGSDLDLVYIAQNERDANYPADAKVPYVVKISRLVQRLTQMLTLQTVSGTLYEVDNRLRPDGESGPIVAQLQYLQQYYESRAWMWELQALVRARCIAGSDELCQQFEQLRETVICMPRESRELARKVIDMRHKMLETKASKAADIFDLKNDLGGITDIEFMVQYMVLAHAHENSGLCEYSDNVRLLERLAEGDYLSHSVAGELSDIYCQFRNRTHRLALQAQTTRVADDEYRTERKRIRECWRQLIESEAAQ